jgi:hypothetical protein
MCRDRKVEALKGTLVLFTSVGNGELERGEFGVENKCWQRSGKELSLPSQDKKIK